MGDEELIELYFRTTLELMDDDGQLWRISPTDAPELASDPRRILAPFSDAYILTAENPESSGEFGPDDNAQATARLRALLAEAPVTFRDCPGFAWDSDHVEPGFAVFSDGSRDEEILEFTREIARSFRQNAIFHLSVDGLGIIGVLRPELRGVRRVVCERV